MLAFLDPLLPLPVEDHLPISVDFILKVILGPCPLPGNPRYRLRSWGIINNLLPLALASCVRKSGNSSGHSLKCTFLYGDRGEELLFSTFSIGIPYSSGVFSQIVRHLLNLRALGCEKTDDAIAISTVADIIAATAIVAVASIAVVVVAAKAPVGGNILAAIASAVNDLAINADSVA